MRLASRWAAVAALLAFTAMAMAQREWLSLEMNGELIGYSWYETAETDRGRTDTSETIVRAKALGQDISLDARTTTTYNGEGAMVDWRSVTTSGGRTVDVRLKRLGDGYQMWSAPSASPKMVTPKAGIRVHHDPLQLLLEGDVKTVQVQTFDANLLDFVVIKVTDQGKTDSGRLVRIDDPRAPSTAVLDDANNVVRIDGPMGMVMRPATAEVARKLEGARGDIAVAAAIPYEGATPKPRMSYRLEGLSRELPTDGHQTFVDGVLTVHPVTPSKEAPTMQAAIDYSGYLKPTDRIESDNPAITQLANRIAQATDKHERVQQLREHVWRNLRVNAGIGVLRDATEIWTTREGVCRDHAILMASLVRAIGVPAKLVSGIVLAGDAFYYHAWIEYWDGTTWIGVDSTRPAKYLSSSHIKVAEGNVAEAYSQYLLDATKVIGLP